MKKLILSEGKNDTAFLKEVINNYHNSWEIKVFDIDSQPSDTRIPKETDEIRNFKQRFNPYDVLVKSEGGKPNLIQVAPTIIKRQSTTDIDFDFLLDLDHDSITDITSKINDALRTSSAGKDIRIAPCGDRTRNSPIVSQELEILSNDTTVSTFNMVFLDPELEAIIGIENSDSEDIIQKKIEQAVQEDGLAEPIVNSLF